MKINNIQHLLPSKDGNNNNTDKDLQNNDNICKLCDTAALQCSANYNIAFAGIFNHKNAKIEEKDTYIKTENVTEKLKMIPNTEYLVSENTIFSVDGYEIPLNNKHIKEMIDKLPINKELVIGREATPSLEFPKTVSRQHFSIRKDNRGRLIAKDLNSLNGTDIMPNLIVPSNTENGFTLEKGKRYLLPKTSILSVGGIIFEFNKYNEILKKLNNGESVSVGRESDADIALNSGTVSREHLSITKFDNGYIVKDLGSKNGTKFLRKDKTLTNIPYSYDYSDITDIAKLKPNMPTLLPKNSQLVIGDVYTLDTRNPNLLSLLDKKGRVTIGRNSNCDIVVNSWNSKVSREHLLLQKDGDELIATDTNPTNATKVVPQNQIKAFYSGVKDIKIAQSNIGDCYLLSTIYALSVTPNGQKMLENMVSVDKDGNYIVKFYNEAPITVKLEELDGQKDSKRKKRPEKKSVSGELGAKAIERAYAKLIKSNSFNSSCTMFDDIDKGGRMETALLNMTGIHSLRFKPTEYNLSKIIEMGTDNAVITCSTPYKLKNMYCGFIANHAYAVNSIDAKNRTIELVNPHDTTTSQIITWEEFSSIFEDIVIAKI